MFSKNLEKKTWFKKCWVIFEFRLIISSFVDLIPSLIKENFHLMYSWEQLNLCSESFIRLNFDIVNRCF